MLSSTSSAVHVVQVRVALLGLGASASGPAAFKGLGEAVAAAAKSAQAVHVAVVLASSSQGLSSLNIASAIATGTVLGTFEDTRYKTESKKSFLKSVDIIGLGTGPEVEKKLKYAGDVSSGVLLGRELVNSPPNVLTPEINALKQAHSEEVSTLRDEFQDKIDRLQNAFKTVIQQCNPQINIESIEDLLGLSHGDANSSPKDIRPQMHSSTSTHAPCHGKDDINDGIQEDDINDKIQEDDLNDKIQEDDVDDEFQEDDIDLDDEFQEEDIDGEFQEDDVDEEFMEDDISNEFQ
ncbi:unnamed protein product [Vicia faba]|uniref:Peptidase M17 leucyl aminopeptidase N-terminal domain-containing protein n=1 Tax=Vicia faba TaxID=3906 RepID=A0AAV0ZZX5_VICFA|nr:unnamed protein product [Vicia faba]